jgi:hypothetical protein
MRLVAALGASLFLCGCAGKMLNENTLMMSPSIGTVEERQILQNLAKFVDNPWAIPGHVELANGQIQITNQLGANLKFPYTKVLNGAGAITSKTLGDEADITPAQTQDQESYNLLPVTDSEDLRRLRALYHYAVCPGDRNAFSLEWGLADQRYFRSAPTARASHTKSAAAKTPTLADVIRKDLTDAEKTKAGPEATANLIAGKIAPVPTQDQVKSIKDIVASKDEDIDGKVADIIQAVGKEARLLKRYAAPTPGKAVAGKSDQTKGATPTDSVAYEEYKKDVILSPLGLGSEPWLFVKAGDGTFASACRDANYGVPLAAPNAYLGTAGGFEFWTNDRKKFSDLVIFVLGGIPNTVGSHIIGGAPSKATTTQFFTINGQPSAVTLPKANAR